MRNEAGWKPTKFALRGERLIAGPSASAGSWLNTQLVAENYGSRIARYARGRLLDLGCGTAPLYAAYRPHVAQIVCVDWAGSVHADSYVDVPHDLNEPLPFGSGEFDTVIFSDVLEHVKRPSEVLAEIRRVLAPSGVMLLNVPFFYWLHEQPHDYYRYTEHSLRWMAETAGFQVLELEPFGGGPAVLADIVGKHLQQVPVVGRGSARALQRLTHRLLGIRAVSRGLAASRQRFPLGYFLIAQNPG
jgi:SAM-dependent methyltransferase